MTQPQLSWAQGTFLAALQRADRDELLTLGSPRTFTVGSAFVREGERGTDLYVLLQGCVKVLGNTVDGHTTLLAIRVPGDLVGELAGVRNDVRSATVLAATRCVVRCVDRPTFDAFLQRRPAAAREFMASITGKLQQATRLRIDLTGGSAAVRLARILLPLYEAHALPGREGAIGMPLSQRELAALAGVAPASIYRSLAGLRATGVVDTGYRQIIVRDPVRLARLARGENPEGR
ncbi:Crp/Fnr family transcriptional regulator [Dactylosporangium sp. NPDC000521]|uniref:Crp/Fnr family transcriptional regulator n=1 Tax=Dactylosporangium sp. NPDC000521 TaxID=3363975 RepID=UPI0036967E9B